MGRGFRKKIKQTNTATTEGSLTPTNTAEISSEYVYIICDNGTGHRCRRDTDGCVNGGTTGICETSGDLIWVTCNNGDVVQCNKNNYDCYDESRIGICEPKRTDCGTPIPNNVSLNLNSDGTKYTGTCKEHGSVLVCTFNDFC